MKSHKIVIVVHGGAGDWPSELHKPALSGVRKAADLGFGILNKGGAALDAVEAAVVSLEDNPIFNAGTGSTLNLLGEIETDAGIMDGKTLRGGAVALLKNIRNPIRVARIVMEQTNHVLIAGTAAEKLALKNGIAKSNLKVPRRVKAWRRGLIQIKHDSRRNPTKRTLETFLEGGLGTVGALALDVKGNLCAGDSTGGISLKLPGRIGDSPILGAGLYADNRCGAATATGVGEQAMRLVISKTACDMMRTQTGPAAAIRTIRAATRTMGAGTGILTLDRKGRFGVAHNTRHLCWASTTDAATDEGITGRRVTQ